MRNVRENLTKNTKMMIKLTVIMFHFLGMGIGQNPTMLRDGNPAKLFVSKYNNGNENKK